MCGVVSYSFWGWSNIDLSHTRLVKTQRQILNTLTKLCCQKWYFLSYLYRSKMCNNSPWLVETVLLFFHYLFWSQNDVSHHNIFMKPIGSIVVILNHSKFIFKDFFKDLFLRLFGVFSCLKIFFFFSSWTTFL